MAKRVKEAHSFDSAGVPITMKVGTLVDNDDPRVKGREQFYEDADTAASRTSIGAAGAVETMTAAPGERRSRSLKLPSNAA